MLAMLDVSLDAVLHFEVDLSELEARIAKRQEEEGRDDDSVEIFERRMREYRDQTTNVVPHYRDTGLLADIDAPLGTVDEVEERVLAACRSAVG